MLMNTLHWFMKELNKIWKDTNVNFFSVYLMFCKSVLNLSFFIESLTIFLY